MRMCWGPGKSDLEVSHTQICGVADINNITGQEQGSTVFLLSTFTLPFPRRFSLHLHSLVTQA